MSRLRIYSDDDPVTPDYHSTDHASIAEQLEKIGVKFEQWEATKPVAPGATPEEVMAAYKEDIDRLVKHNGFKTVDVVSISPDNENREAMRAKFLDEHFHKEDEVRFFVAGSGLFTLHVDDRVYEVKCDTLSVVADERRVAIERLEHFHQKDGKRDFDLPVLGVFELENGKITAWRDYFDLKTFTG